MIDPIGLAAAGVGVARGVVRSALDAAGPDGLFAQLLGSKTGALSSRPATIAEGVDLPLTEDQLRMIGDAADRARAAGAERAVVRIDGMLLEIDTESRQIVGEVKLQSDELLVGIDAFMDLNGPDQTSADAGAILRSLAAR